MNKTKEAVETLLSRIEDDIAYFDTGKDDTRSIDYEFGNLEIRVTDLYTLRATLKAVLASLPDEGELVAPDVIYLLLHEGDEGSHIWCDHIPNDEMEAVKYIRPRALQQRLDKEIGDE